jgi:hypothetical protein
MNFRRIYESCLSARLNESVVVENGTIYIEETEEDKTKNDNELKVFYKNYAIQQIKTNPGWKAVVVENTDPPLTVQILPSCIDEWFSHPSKREQTLCIQAIPHIVQKMTHIEPETENKGKPNVEYWYKSKCQVFVNKCKHTIRLSIIKRKSEEHRFYAFYVVGLNIKAD